MTEQLQTPVYKLINLISEKKSCISSVNFRDTDIVWYLRHLVILQFKGYFLKKTKLETIVQQLPLSKPPLYLDISQAENVANRELNLGCLV